MPARPKLAAAAVALRFPRESRIPAPLPPPVRFVRTTESREREAVARRYPARTEPRTCCSPLDIQPSRHGTWKHYSTFNSSLIKFNPSKSAMHTPAQIRWASQSARSASSGSKISIGPKAKESLKDSKEDGVVYHGPISSTIKKVKLLSLSTCCLSVSLGPVITFMTSPDMNVILKGAVASTVIFLSASTTGALHWFVSPYIHKLQWRPGSETFEVEMMSWLATPVTRTLKFADVRPAETNRPFVTFKADGSFYFVDADHCPDKNLLARLTPEKPAHGSAFKNL